MHARNYKGTDDDMYEQFNEWIGGFDPDEWVNIAQRWSDDELAKVKAVII
jgi:hypothetical protein